MKRIAIAGTCVLSLLFVSCDESVLSEALTDNTIQDSTVYEYEEDIPEESIDNTRSSCRHNYVHYRTTRATHKHGDNCTCRRTTKTSRCTRCNRGRVTYDHHKVSCK